MVEVTWKTYEAKMKASSGEEQVKATEAFLAERELQTKTSSAARKWEEDRKKEFDSHKPKWHKDKFEAKEKLANKSWDKLLKAGSFQSDLIPAPGYVLLGVEEKEEVTDTGIIISHETEEPNEGVVLEVGKDLVTDKNIIPRPVEVGDRILFKRGAGLNLKIKDKSCKLIYFPDILGIFK